MHSREPRPLVRLEMRVALRYVHGTITSVSKLTSGLDVRRCLRENGVHVLGGGGGGVARVEMRTRRVVNDSPC